MQSKVNQHRTKCKTESIVDRKSLTLHGKTGPRQTKAKQKLNTEHDKIEAEEDRLQT